MGVKDRRTISLRTLLLRYLIVTMVVLAVALSTVVGLFIGGRGADLYTYAGSAEESAHQAADAITAAGSFDASEVPASCRYALVAPDDTILQSDMPDDQAQHALGFVQGSLSGSDGDGGYYVQAACAQGVCVLRYTIGAHYTSQWAEDHLPNIELVMMATLVLVTIGCCIAVAALFARRMGRALEPVAAAARSIRASDLDFTTGRSPIREFDDIAVSMEDMRTALKDSLETQWTMEQSRKQQVTELAHDLKTPLAIVRGNAELLQDDTDPRDVRRHAAGVSSGVARLEQGIAALGDADRFEAGRKFHPGRIEVADFAAGLVQRARALAEGAGICLDVERVRPDGWMMADADMLDRAVMNIVANAVERSTRNAAVSLSVECVDACVLFIVEDRGPGFSPEALRHARERFFTSAGEGGVGERPGQVAHHGLGLSIADDAARLHCGRLSLQNASATGGAIVTLELPLVP